MCFNAPVSLAAFLSGVVVSLVVGTYALSKNEIPLALLSFGWIWVIFMQLWEYMAWRGIETETASHMAYVFNVMQIPVLYLLFILVKDTPTRNRWVATLVMAAYLCVMFYPLSADETRIAETCGHLDYRWWRSRLRVAAYFTGLCAVFLLLVRPLMWSTACLATLLFLMVLSTLFYTSNVASLWCFFAVFFPVAALVLKKVLPS
jgi:hypothetical protein